MDGERLTRFCFLLGVTATDTDIVENKANIELAPRKAEEKQEKYNHNDNMK